MVWVMYLNTMAHADVGSEACKADIGGVLGVKESMIAHILGKGGNTPCPNTSSEAWKAARRLKKGKGKREQEDSSSKSGDDDLDTEKKPKRKLLTKVETLLKQSQLKVFQGINVPFTDEQEKLVHKQFLHTTISANLPFWWVDDPEVMILFVLFQLTVCDIMPLCKQFLGQLLDDENMVVMKQVKAELWGKYAIMASDGWKDDSRNLINGVNLSIQGKVRLHASIAHDWTLTVGQWRHIWLI